MTNEFSCNRHLCEFQDSEIRVDPAFCRVLARQLVAKGFTLPDDTSTVCPAQELADLARDRALSDSVDNVVAVDSDALRLSKEL